MHWFRNFNASSNFPSSASFTACRSRLCNSFSTLSSIFLAVHEERLDKGSLILMAKFFLTWITFDNAGNAVNG